MYLLGCSHVCMYVCMCVCVHTGASMKVFTRINSNNNGSGSSAITTIAYYTNGTMVGRPNLFTAVPLSFSSSSISNNAFGYALRVRPPLNVYSVPANQIIASFSFFAVDGITG